MTLSFYFDDDSEAIAVTEGLRRAGVGAMRSTPPGNRGLPDNEHLEFAALFSSVLVTANRGDFIQLHWQWIEEGRDHAGICIAT